MTDGRVFTLEDEIDVLHEDLGRARRRLDSLERAPFESRVCDPEQHEASLRAARENVAELERELREARMSEQAALDAQDAAA